MAASLFAIWHEDRPPMITAANAFVLGFRRTALEKLFKATFLKSHAEMNDGDAELGMLASLIPPGSTTVDVGANVGDFSRRLAELSKGGLVLAFEPQGLARSVMSIAGFLKKSANILVIPLALGDRSGLISLNIPVKAGGKIGSGLAHIGDASDLAQRFEVRKELVAVATLDDVLARLEVGPISFIKIDVEGGELAVLRGAVATIDRDRPAVLCEIDAREGRFGVSQADLVDFFKSKNYVPRRINDLAVLEYDALEKNTVFTPG
jgi:FkbM family methyltransferase